MYDCAGSARWFAIRTVSGREKAVSTLLEHKGYEDFLPVYKTRRRWSDRAKALELPLFPGYLFCRFPIGNRLPILVTPGVKLIVGYGRMPTPVKDEQVDALRKVVSSGIPAVPCPYLEVGQRVEIREGSLAGLHGILLQTRNSSRIVVSVELLRRSVAVEVDRFAVTLVRQDTDDFSGTRAAGQLSAGGRERQMALEAGS